MPRAGFLFDSWTGLFLLKAVSFLETDPLAATRAKPTAGECAVQPEAVYKAPRCLRSARRDQTSVGLRCHCERMGECALPLGPTTQEGWEGKVH